MKDITFNAAIDSAKFVAKTKDEKTIRRVVFKFARTFSFELAEWLGDEAGHMRKLMTDGALEKFTIPIDAYVAKMTAEGVSGTAEAEVYGIEAAASMTSGENPQPMLAVSFEAFPEAKLLTFIAASLKEFVDVELLATQTTIDERLKKAVDGLREAVGPEGSLTVTADGKRTTVPGKAKNGGGE